MGRKILGPSASVDAGRNATTMHRHNTAAQTVRAILLAPVFISRPFQIYFWGSGQPTRLNSALFPWYPELGQAETVTIALAAPLIESCSGLFMYHVKARKPDARHADILQLANALILTRHSCNRASAEPPARTHGTPG